jgi:hypothetical protein
MHNENIPLCRLPDGVLLMGPRSLDGRLIVLSHDIQIDLIYLTCQTPLLSHIFQSNGGHSRFAIEFDLIVNEFQKVEAQTMNPHRATREVSERAKSLPQTPARPKSSERIDFLGRRGGLGTITERIVGLFVSC